MCRLSRNALEYTALFLWGNKTIFLYNKQNNTWMFGNMKFLVLNRISHSFTLLACAILVDTRNKFHISTHPCIILYLLLLLFFINSPHCGPQPTSLTHTGEWLRSYQNMLAFDIVTTLQSLWLYNSWYNSSYNSFTLHQYNFLHLSCYFQSPQFFWDQLIIIIKIIFENWHYQYNCKTGYSACVGGSRLTGSIPNRKLLNIRFSPNSKFLCQLKFLGVEN